MPIWRVVLLDQKKSILAHACPPALYGVAIGFNCFLYLLALGRMALGTDDNFLENKVRRKLNPVEPLRVLCIVKSYEHPHLLFIAPALVLGARQSICDIGEVLQATDL